MNKLIKASYIFYSFLILGFLNGFLLALQFVKSQSYFLTYFPAKNLVFAFFIPLLVWYVISFLVRDVLNKPKFVHLFYPWLLFLGILLTISSFFASKSPYMVVLWIFISGIYAEFFRWSIMEMQERYVNPSKIGSIISFQNICNEAGLLCGLLILTVFSKMTLFHLTNITWTVVLIKIGIIALIFLNPRALEIHHLRQSSQNLFQNIFKEKIYLYYVLLGLFFGLYKAAQDTLANGFFQTSTQDRIQIQSLISNAMLAGSFLQMITSFVNGRLLESNRVSPIKTLNFSWTLYLILGLVCISINSIWSYVIFLSLSKGFAGIYFPTTARISGAYENSKKIFLRTLHFWGAIVLTSFIFYFIPPQHNYLVGLIVFSFAGVLFANWKIQHHHILDLQNLIFSKNLSDSVRAAVGLSYLKPKEFFKSAEKILDQNPHKLLKKQIILGLGYLKDERSIERLIQEFNSDKEEIQITVVEALKMAKNNKATKFALDLVLTNRKTLTPRVRLNASQIIAALYGEKSIPILMLGLQEDDNRMIANVIDALSQFQSPELVETYLKYSKSTVPRIRANALIALLKYPDQKASVFNEIEKTLNDKNHIGDQISIFYVIGKNKVSIFKDQLIKLHKSLIFDDFKNLDAIAMSYVQTLSWALLRLQVNQGYDSLLRLLVEVSDPQRLKSLLHFYVQLEDIEKFDCIDYWLMNSNDKLSTQRFLIEIFTVSGFDFSDEISYLNSLNLN